MLDCWTDGPVPLPVWAKWGGHPGPAPSPLVGVRGPTWGRKWQPTPVFLPENPRDGEPGGLPSMGLHRVGHD